MLAPALQSPRILRWRGRERRWRFPLLTTIEAPEDGCRFLVFDELIPRTGLDLGVAVHDAMFEALQAEQIAI